MRPLAMVLTLVLVLGSVASAAAQQVQLTTPFQSINDSFYENFGIGWAGINRMGPNGGWFFRGMPANSAPPPFGGYDPGADARFGFRAGPFGFNVLAGQGSSRSNVMQAPTIVIPNGGSGYLFDGSISPFVMGVVPVVGSGGPFAGPMPTTSPLAERLERLQQSGGIPAATRAEPPDEPAAAQAPHAEALPAARDDAPLVIKSGRVVDPPAVPRSSPSRSTASHGDLSLDEIQQRQSAEDVQRQHEVLLLVEKGRGKEAEGKPGLARIYYQQAASRAQGLQKEQLLAKVRSLGD